MGNDVPRGPQSTSLVLRIRWDAGRQFSEIIEKHDPVSSAMFIFLRYNFAGNNTSPVESVKIGISPVFGPLFLPGEFSFPVSFFELIGCQSGILGSRALPVRRCNTLAFQPPFWL